MAIEVREVARWGNSAALRIPKNVMEQAGLKEGDEVNIVVESPGVIVVRATNQFPSLETLLSGISESNRHEETDWGKPKGKELW